MDAREEIFQEVGMVSLEVEVIKPLEVSAGMSIPSGPHRGKDLPLKASKCDARPDIVK